MLIDRKLDEIAAALAGPWKHVHPDSCPPILAHAASRRYCETRRYGPHGLYADVWRRPDTPPGGPTLLFVPGGAWLSGRRVGQGYAMFRHLVDRGYVCVSIDYRTSPLHRWPAHLQDVQDAIAWVHQEFDPSFLVLAGASAGGHLASLAGLTGAPVDAVVSLYGAYDWANTTSLNALGTGILVAAVVVQRPCRSLLRAASPINHVHPGAPPFLIMHGSHDHLTPAAEARRFYHELRRVSRARTEYVEVPGGHAFDLVRCRSTATAIEAMDRFLGSVAYARDVVA